MSTTFEGTSPVMHLQDVAPPRPRSWTVTLQEVDGECVIPIPEEIMGELDLSVGDSVRWTIRDGAVYFTKA